MARSHRIICTGLLALFGLAILSLASPAGASKKNYDRMINFAGMERMLTQKIVKSVMLLSLNVDVEHNVKELHHSRDLFVRTLQGLREGDDELGLPPTTDPHILGEILSVSELWALIDPAIEHSIESGTISAGEVSIIADLNLPLLEAADHVVDAYVKEATAGNLYSMVSVAIDTTGQQRLLTQKMAKEFLLVAYGHKVSENRGHLARSIDQFDRTLRALAEGDFDMHLLPPPTAELRAQFANVTRLWDELHPIVKSAAEGGQIEQGDILAVAQKNMPLLKEINKAIFMYESL